MGTKGVPIREEAERLGIDLTRLPRHIAIIMEGNGRWAQRRGLGRMLGNREGYKALRSVLLNVAELGVPYLTVYAFSAENWRRPQEEVSGLMKLIERAARDELAVMHRNNVRVRFIGRLEGLPIGLREAILQGLETTKNNTGVTFTLAINYGGRAEIVDAVRRIVAEGIPAEQIDEQTVARHLYQPDIPDPDLMIRTAGEMRWSNFLIWQSAYSELYVTDVAWPDFSKDELLEAVHTYQHRVRKFGGVPEA
ncbi:MAG: polyprenyl diphosphate synthase [Fimbriimonadaceae bacterium]